MPDPQKKQIAEQFAQLVTLVNANHNRHFAPAPNFAEALKEVGEHYEMLQANCDDGDGALIVLENLAELIAATARCTGFKRRLVTSADMEGLLDTFHRLLNDERPELEAAIATVGGAQ